MRNDPTPVATRPTHDLAAGPSTGRGDLLITGANGFVGRALIRAAASHGWFVRAATRSGQPLEGAGMTCPIGSIGPETDWSAALPGCQAVIHLAGLAQASEANRAACFRVNVEATRHLAEQAAASGVRRFVFLSTVKVLGESSPPGRPFVDTDRPAPEGEYALSKWAAEQALFEVAGRSGLEVVVLRPPAVYGPGMKGNLHALLSAIARGLPLPLGASGARRSLCYLGNLNDAILHVVDYPGAAGQTFLVGDAETLELSEFIRRMAQALGRPARLPAISPAWLRLIGRMLGRAATIRQLTESLEIEPRSLKESTGWQAPHSIDAGLAITVGDFLGKR